MSNYNSWQLTMTFDVKDFVCTQAICIRKLRKGNLRIIILDGHCYIKTLKNTFKKMLLCLAYLPSVIQPRSNSIIFIKFYIGCPCHDASSVFIPFQ
jgi:hypothetical protein